MSEAYIDFKYKKNVIIDIGNGSLYPIPYRMEPHVILGKASTVPVFNLEKVHRVELLSEQPDLTEASGETNEKLRSLIEEEAFQIARQNRLTNKRVRQRIAAYVKSGSIEIVHDSTKKEPKAKPAPDTAKSGKASGDSTK